METVALPFADTNDRRGDIVRLLTEAFPDMDGDFYGPCDPWMLVLGQSNGEIIAHLAVYVREALLDQTPSEIGLLGGIAIADNSRGKGWLRPLIEDAHRLLKKRGIHFSVLFAFNHLHYTSAGYLPMTNETRFVEAGASRQFVYRGGMVASLDATPWRVRTLDLQGEVV